MCFTVAIIRKGVLMTAEEYYKSLPVIREKNIKQVVPKFPDFYLVSGFSYPKLPILKDDGIFMLQWGLIPSWIKDTESAHDIRSKTLNAMGETVFEKPSFRNNINSHRCLLPVSGFYEWRDLNGLKYPYYIQSNEGEMFTLGAIYDIWLDKLTGEMLETFSIITTAANPLMEKIHNLKKRMPLIVSEKDEEKWLDRSLKREQIAELIKPFPDKVMKAHTISRNASNAGFPRNVPEITKEVIYPELIHEDSSLF